MKHVNYFFTMVLLFITIIFIHSIYRDCVELGTDAVCDICIKALRNFCRDTGVTYAQINIFLFIMLEPFLILIGFALAFISIYYGKKTFCGIVYFCSIVFSIILLLVNFKYYIYSYLGG